MLFFLSFAVCATAAIDVPPADTFQMIGEGFDVTIKAHGDVLVSFEVKLPDVDDPAPVTFSTYDFHISFPDMGMSIVCERVAAEITPMRLPVPIYPNGPSQSPTLVTPIFGADEADLETHLGKFLDMVTDPEKEKQVREVFKTSKCKTNEAKYKDNEWGFALFYVERDGRKTYDLSLATGLSPDDPAFIVIDAGGFSYMCGVNMGRTKNILGPCVDEKGVLIDYSSGLSSGPPWAVIIAVVLVILSIGVAIFLCTKKKKELLPRLPEPSKSPVTSGRLLAWNFPSASGEPAENSIA